MADDIQIKGASDDGNKAGNPPASDTAAQSTAKPAQPAGQQGQTAQPAAEQAPAKPKTFTLDEEAAFTEQQLAPPEKYSIPALVKEKFPDLMQLIKETESMNDEERDYWFQILPIMTEDQISKFRDILVNEKEQLARLDTEYEQELGKLNEKHMIEWKEFETREKRKQIETAEKKSQEEEKSTEEELLQRLSQI